ncbi:MAG: serine protease [Lachnospiraceae bacterium]|nr:serine protease [Lachnospiraceae bacterium]
MKKIIAAVTAVIICIICIGFVLIYPSLYEKKAKTAVDPELQNGLKKVSSANIGVITVTEEEGMTGYSAGASGVIFERQDRIYYAITAYHVVAKQDGCLVLTASTETFREYYSGTGHGSVEEYYSRLPRANIEYVSEESDLAIIRFESDRELDVASVSTDVPTKKDRIVTVGTQEGDFFTVTYGKILSDKLINFAANDEYRENKVMKHSAYVTYGNSGGAVFDTNMQIIGMNIGGGTDVFGRFRYGAMIPCDQIQKSISAFCEESEIFS